MKQRQAHVVWIITLVLAAGMACQLTSPRPASWAGTPTAEARMTEIAITQSALRGDADYVFTPTVPSATPEETPTPTLTPTPHIETSGPWLIFAAPKGDGLTAYDVNRGVTHQISLPEPVIAEDLTHGFTPDGNALFVRAGSVMNAEELALYQVDLPARTDLDAGFTVSRVSSLLSISLQRQIVNQEGTRALEALTTVTRPDGLAWSPDGRFLAFTAALNNETSNLYVFDTLNDRVNRANRYLTQTASPLWAPDSTWLIAQELELNRFTEDWRSAVVAGLIMPSFINQDVIYSPPSDSREEVFIGWRNIDTVISYSLTAGGPSQLRQITLNNLRESMIFPGSFTQVAFDPDTGIFALILSLEDAVSLNKSGGIYRILPDSTELQFQQGGNWDNLIWDPAGRFVASGSQGVVLFTPNGEGLFFQGQGNARLSPLGNWVLAWGDGENSASGVRLHQSSSNHPLQTLLEGRIESVFWQPDSMAFFIQSEGVLYHFAFPGLKPLVIADSLPLDTPLEWLWVD